MDIYRLFILDAHENLVSGVDLRSDSDDEALEWSSFVVLPHRIGELWCGTRCVGRIERAQAGKRVAAIGRAGQVGRPRAAVAPSSLSMGQASA
jgi:hypothetical protein